MILAGDIGGTKTQLALFAGEPFQPREFRTYPTQEFDGPFSLLEHYLSQVKAKVEVLSLAVAGPVLYGEVYMVNVGWRFSEGSLASALGGCPVYLLNDLEALAFALPHLDAQDLVEVKPGQREAEGNAAVLAAGTGLGEAFLIRRRAPGPIPVATEGGHAEFYPTDELTWGLREFLAERYGHVSLERVVSGPGIENIYQFLCAREGVAPRYSSAKEIGEAGLAGEPLPRKCLELFVAAYGAEAGNMALRCLATGGVFLGGGIAPKLLPLIQSPLFQRSFLDKGRLSSFLQDVPVFVVKHAYPVLYGAALYARAQRERQ